MNADSKDAWNQVVNKVRKHRAEIRRIHADEIEAPRRRFDDSELERMHKHQPMPAWAEREAIGAKWIAVLAALIVLLLPWLINRLFDFIDTVMR